MKRKTISAYLISLNAIEIDLPFREVITNALSFSDEVVVVDGGSSDGTLDALYDLGKQNPKLKVYTNDWRYDRLDMMGVQKTFARRKCSGDYCFQQDLDELLPEWQFSSLHKLIRNFPYVILFDLPVITFSGGMLTVGRQENFFKWRLSKNVPGIIHGVNANACRFDERGNILFNREDSDSCEYIWEHNREIIKRFGPLDKRLWNYNLQLMDKVVPDNLVEEYSRLISELANGTEIPCVFHYSWVDYERKAYMSKFWAKQARHYANNGVGTREGKWIDKDSSSITEEDISNLTLEFHKRPFIPVKIKRHPAAIMEWAKSHCWNQLSLIKKELVVL